MKELSKWLLWIFLNIKSYRSYLTLFIWYLSGCYMEFPPSEAQQKKLTLLYLSSWIPAITNKAMIHRLNLIMTVSLCSKLYKYSYICCFAVSLDIWKVVEFYVFFFPKILASKCVFQCNISDQTNDHTLTGICCQAVIETQSLHI